MKVAVIILNYNSSDDCRKCVSFLKWQKGVELELVLVDNCSPDGDKVEALCREQGCTFIASPENRGYNAGNNIGLRYAAEKGYKYALIANPDMEFPQTDYVKRLVEVMEKDEDIVVAGSDIVGADGIRQNPTVQDGRWINNYLWIAEQFKLIKKEYYLDNPQKSHYCTKVSGCCLIIKMDFIQSIGFFDEYPFLYCEEAILSRQVEKKGKRMYYLAEVQAIHHHIASQKGDSIKRFYQWRRSRIYFIKQYCELSWFGKQLAIISIQLYVKTFLFTQTLKKLLYKTKQNNKWNIL